MLQYILYIIIFILIFYFYLIKHHFFPNKIWFRRKDIKKVRFHSICLITHTETMESVLFKTFVYCLFFQYFMHAQAMP